MGTGIAPSRTHPVPTPGTPPLAPSWHVSVLSGQCGQLNVVVGLRSVDQLSLDRHFSGFQGMTEGYNLGLAGNPNDHNPISGTD